MTSDEQRKADLDSLQRYAAFLTMPGDESSPTLTAMARQLPHLLACARFVEEHGDTLGYALGYALGFAEGCPENTDALTQELLTALRALAALRKP